MVLNPATTYKKGGEPSGGYKDKSHTGTDGNEDMVSVGVGQG